jgi:DNA topoisomerase IB
MDPSGHLQATGRDARARKQYRYHPRWRSLRDGQKFDRMPAFGEVLPRLRRKVRKDMLVGGLPREKVLAVVVSLLDATRLRIGNAEYARSNASYGLTTLRNDHVRFVRGAKLVFRFRGKGGAEHEVTLQDKRLVPLVRHCHQLPGQRLFQYVDEAGELRAIDSDQVNQYLKEAMGYDFTAKGLSHLGSDVACHRDHACDTAAGTRERANSQLLHRRRRQEGRDRTSQHARGLPQVLHQSPGLRCMAQRSVAQRDRRNNHRRAAACRTAGTSVSAAAEPRGEPTSALA